jgi:hypothetical protein
MSHPQAPWWIKYGSLGQIAQATVALCAFAAILVQINVLIRNGRETGARQIYLAYNDLEFKNPQFATPDLEHIKAGPPNDLIQYEVFVSYFLYACEEALGAFSNQREWQAACDYDLKYHLPFLCEKQAAEPIYLTTYSAETQQWVGSQMRRLGVSAPDCKVRKT